MPYEPTEQDREYMLAHIDDTLIPNIIACVVICGVLTAATVALRFWSRWMAGSRVLLNDWLIVGAFIFATFYFVIFGVSTEYGSGRHIILIEDSPKLKTFHILHISSEIMYCASMTLIKWSILSLYGSIFPNKKFRYCLAAVAVFMGGWFISAFFVSIFQCHPIRRTWTPELVDATCINYGLFLVVNCAISVATHFVILAMPIPLVIRLNLSTQKKYMLVATFAIGGFACLVGIIRLAFSPQVGSTSNGPWDNVPSSMLVCAELLVAIIAASAPTFNPLYRRALGHPVDRPAKGSANNTFFDPNAINVTENIDLVTHTRQGNTWVQVTDNDPRIAAAMASRDVAMPATTLPYSSMRYTTRPRAASSFSSNRTAVDSADGDDERKKSEDPIMTRPPPASRPDPSFI